MPKHQEEFLEYIHFPEELDMCQEFNWPAESPEELDMRKEFNRPAESPEELDMRQEFNKLALHLELKRRVDSMVDSMASLLDIAQVVPILPTTTLKINIQTCRVRDTGARGKTVVAASEGDSVVFENSTQIVKCLKPKLPWRLDTNLMGPKMGHSGNYLQTLILLASILG